MKLSWERSWKCLSWGQDSDIKSGFNSVSLWVSVRGHFVGISW